MGHHHRRHYQENNEQRSEQHLIGFVLLYVNGMAPFRGSIRSPHHVIISFRFFG